MYYACKSPSASPPFAEAPKSSAIRQFAWSCPIGFHVERVGWQEKEWSRLRREILHDDALSASRVLRRRSPPRREPGWSPVRIGVRTGHFYLLAVRCVRDQSGHSARHPLTPNCRQSLATLSSPLSGPPPLLRGNVGQPASFTQP